MKNAGWARYQFTVGVLLIGLLASLAASGCASGGDSGDKKTTESTPTTAAIKQDTADSGPPSLTVSAENAFVLNDKSSGKCKALAPADWGNITDPTSIRVDMLASTGTMYAGWGVKEVKTGLAFSARKHRPPLNDPELYSEDPATTVKAYASLVVHSNSFAVRDSSDFKYTKGINRKVGDYSLRSIESKKFAGLVLYHTKGFKGHKDVTYVEPMHIAITTKDIWPTNGLYASKLAMSIRCTPKAMPKDGQVNLSLLKGDKKDPGSLKEPGYDPKLGTEIVHSPDTGENFLVSPSVNWSKTGPEGAGYYVPRGTDDWVKLEPGMSGI